MSLSSGVGYLQKRGGWGVSGEPTGSKYKLQSGAVWALPSLQATAGGCKAYPACLPGHAKGPRLGALPWALKLMLAHGCQENSDFPLGGATWEPLVLLGPQQGLQAGTWAGTHFLIFGPSTGLQPDLGELSGA